MVGIDISKEAEQGAEENLVANPELANLIELRIRHRQEGSNSDGNKQP